MAIAIERAKLVFRKTERELLRLSAEQSAEAVHSFRTNTRRLQTLMEQLVSDQDRNQKKLLKILNRMRKSAGKVRDIDVQLSALRSLKVPLEPRRKTQLTQQLLELRVKHELKLVKLLNKHDINELHKRLKRAAKDVNFHPRREPLALAQEMLASVSPPCNGADEATLHRYRIVVKRARYVAEFARPSTEAKEFIAQLTHLQDALGHWHDWFTLSRTALDLLGDVTHSPLVAALHNVTRGKFRQAATAVSAIQANAAGLASDRKSGTKPTPPVERAGVAA